MKRQWLLLFFMVMLTVSATVQAQSGLPLYSNETDMAFAAPGALKYGLNGYQNPAMLTYLRHSILDFTFTDARGDWDDFNRWGLFMGDTHLGFGFVHQKLGNGLAVTDYRLSLAGGTRRFSHGLSYGWSGGDEEALDRARFFRFGTLFRPNAYVSLGLTGTTATDWDQREGVADVAIRPLGNEKLTLFGDFALQDHQKLEDGFWSAGAAVEALPGMRLTGRYYEDERLTVGVQMSFGWMGVGSQSHYDADQEYSHNTYNIRLGAYDRTLIRNLQEGDRYLKLNLKGRLKYQRYLWFDDGFTLLSLVKQIDAAKKDDTVAGIALNLSGFNANPSLMWELREKLADFRSSGKHVVIYIDEVTDMDYYLATVADELVLDPVGGILMKGVVMGRTYFKGTLEKVGIGFDEWRYMKYKSAAEAFAREDMSDGDREQMQALADGFYRLLQEGVCEGRGVPVETFEQWINEKTLIIAPEALELGLVDRLARWDDIDDIIKEIEGDSKRTIGTRDLAANIMPVDDHWGEPPQIAVIYALGECAMDDGITARQLVKDVDRARKNDDIEAIVFRVDSPGGSALASDIVAEALKKCLGKKPVIVSQGFVAASGGYWLSMYSDKIVANPTTITGSIGVIGGWIYNTGLKDKLGVTTDMVKTSERSDLGFGMRLPLLGLQLPDRNLKEDEQARIQQSILAMYDVFIDKVATGRDMDAEAVRDIAQGRVWTGWQGIDNGLVDELGGLETAINLAKAEAGIDPDQMVTIVQYPEKGLINPNVFTPSFLDIVGFKIMATESQEDPFLRDLQFRLQHNGQVMPILPLSQMNSLLRIE